MVHVFCWRAEDGGLATYMAKRLQSPTGGPLIASEQDSESSPLLYFVTTLYKSLLQIFSQITTHVSSLLMIHVFVYELKGTLPNYPLFFNKISGSAVHIHPELLTVFYEDWRTFKFSYRISVSYRLINIRLLSCHNGVRAVLHNFIC